MDRSLPTQPRYAIYFAPDPGSSLHRVGSRWLGRDACSGEALPQPTVTGISPQRLAALTQSARHYGLHATLKPPFALAPDRSAEALHDAAARFAARLPAFSAPPLALSSLSGFLALVLSAPSERMHRLCDQCVTEFEPFRAPLTPADIARRQVPSMTDRQRDYLWRWGYPAVFEEFTFHMTLTDRLEEPERSCLSQALVDIMAPLTASPLSVDAIAVFEQPDRSKPFHMTGRFPLRS